MRFNVGKKFLEIVRGDITDQEVDAIVNAANNHLWMGAGVAGAIKRKGGAGIETEAVAQGPVATGTAVITSAGNLKARYVIHAAVMGQDLQTDETLIRQATLSTLQLAEEKNLSSLAIPALGTGVGGFPVEQCAGILIGTILGFFEKNRSLKLVRIVLFDQEKTDLFDQALKDQFKAPS